MYRPWLVGQSLFSLLLTVIAIVMISGGGKGKVENKEPGKAELAVDISNKAKDGGS